MALYKFRIIIIITITKTNRLPRDTRK